MHEVSLMTGILDIVRDEMAKHGAQKLVSLTVRYGALSHVEPEALATAFTVMTAGTANEGARLDLVLEPVLVRCHACGHRFAPPDKRALFGYCPGCSDVTAYQVEEGSGMFVDRIEAV